MTFPTVQATNTSVQSTASTSHVVSLPASIAAGDLLIAIITGIAAAVTTPAAGWNTIEVYNSSGIVGFWRHADGTEGSTATFTSASAAKSVHNSYRISGWGAPPIGSFLNTTGPNANPPSVTHARGSADFLWIAADVPGRTSTGCNVTAAPSGYGSLIKSSETNELGFFAIMASATKTSTAATEDPAAFSDNSNTTAIVYTIGVPGPLATGGIASVTQQASATSTASTITCPTVQVGDLIVLVDKAQNSAGSPTAVTPTGFTSISNIGTGVFRQVASYKIADGTESATSITGMNGTAANQKVLVTYRPDVAATAAYLFNNSGSATTSDPTARLLGVTAIYPAVALGFYGSDGTVDPRTFSPAKDSEVAQSTTLYQAWKIYNSSPQDTTVDMDDEGTNLLQAAWIELFATPVAASAANDHFADKEFQSSRFLKPRFLIRQ